MKKEDLIIGQVYSTPPLESKLIGFADNGHEVILMPMNEAARTRMPLYTEEDQMKNIDKPAGCFRVATPIFIAALNIVERRKNE